MHLHANRLQLSPSDVTAFLACEHLTTLSLAHARAEVERPDIENEQAELIFRKGLEHEQAYLESLRALGKTVLEIPDPRGDYDPAALVTADPIRGGGVEVIGSVSQATEPLRPGRSEERQIVRTMVIAVPVAALLLVAAGCGGSSESSAGDSTTTIASTDTTGGADTTSTDTTDTDADVSLAGCTELADVSVKFSQALGAAASGTGAPDLEETAKVYEEFADQVPEEIRDAFRTVAAAFSTYADALKDVDLKPGQIPDADTLAKLAEAAKGFDNSELTAATAEIEAWVKKNCTTGG